MNKYNNHGLDALLGPYGSCVDSQANALKQSINMGMQSAGLANTWNMLAMQQFQPPSKLDRARERFGRPFKDWMPRAKPVLTEWLEQRQAEAK